MSEPFCVLLIETSIWVLVDHDPHLYDDRLCRGLWYIWKMAAPHRHYSLLGCSICQYVFNE